MSFENLPYLFSKFPERYQRADAAVDYLLRRFLTPFAENMDAWDAIIAHFDEQIAPATATESFIDFWLWWLFGWGWFPRWFTLAQKREFYSDIAMLIARRGTARGITDFLAAFGLTCTVHNGPRAWGEFAWGERTWSITRPLSLIVSIHPMPVASLRHLSAWGAFIWGADPWTPSIEEWTPRMIENLLRFQHPFGQRMFVEYVSGGRVLLYNPAKISSLDFSRPANSAHIATLGL